MTGALELAVESAVLAPSSHNTQPWLFRIGADAITLYADRSRKLALAAPLLAFVTTEDDTPAEWLRAGRALQRVLLGLTAAGVSASFLNQPVEVPELRAELRRQTGGRVPQLLLRVGYGPEVPATPRRPAAEVTLP